MNVPAVFSRSEMSQTLWLFRREFVVCLIFTMVVNVLMLTPALYMMQVFDRVMLSRSDLTLFALTAVTLLFFGVIAFAEWSRTRLLVRCGVKFDQILNARLFDASFEAQLTHTVSQPSQPFSDFTNIRQFLTGQGLFAFLDAPWAPIYIAVLFLLHPWLGWLSVLFSLVLVGVAVKSHNLIKEPDGKASEASIQEGTYIQSKLKNVEVLESMGMLANLRQHWQSLHQGQLRLNHDAQSLASRLQAVSKFVRYAQQSFALGAAALLVLRGELNPVSIFVANVLMGRATAPIDLLVSSWKSFFAARQSYERLETLLDKHPSNIPCLIKFTPAGFMQLEDLVATAPDRELPILKGINLEFAAGLMTVIMGPSGSGKTTLARCLLGIWPDVKGKLRIDSRDLQSWNRNELGPYIGYLPQDIELFDGTIAENISRFGLIDSDKVLTAAVRAGVHEMILRLPQGYDTPIGEAGRFLSGGQRQRIGLARAMYGSPRLIVLDEPNANLDEAGEVALITALHSLKSDGCTVFVITHRSNIVTEADRILILEDGSVRQYGPVAEVFATLITAHSVNESRK